MSLDNWILAIFLKLNFQKLELNLIVFYGQKISISTYNLSPDFQSHILN